MPIDLNGLRGIADGARQIATPIRTTKVTVRRRVWPSQMGIGSPTVTDLVLPAWTKVATVNEREIAASGGRFKLEDITVGPVTPTYPGGGYSEAQLAPVATDDLTEIVYVLSGAVNGEYTLLACSTDRPFRYMLTLRRKETTP